MKSFLWITPADETIVGAEVFDDDRNVVGKVVSQDPDYPNKFMLEVDDPATVKLLEGGRLSVSVGRRVRDKKSLDFVLGDKKSLDFVLAGD